MRKIKFRFIADENIPTSVVKRDNDGIDIRHITEVADKGLEDGKIIELSVKENSIIITFDKDFG